MATRWFIFVEKRHRLQVHCVLILRRGLYTGENFKQVIRKKRKEIGELIYENDLTN